MSIWQWLQSKDELIRQIKQLEDRIVWWKQIADRAEDEYYKERAQSDLAEDYAKTKKALVAAEMEVEDLKRVVTSQAMELEEVRRKKIEERSDA